MKKQKSGKSHGLADPVGLKPFSKKVEETPSGKAKAGGRLLQVVIETPKGSRNKYSFDPEQHVFVL